MALKPLPPRDKSSKELERYRTDLRVARDNPEAYNRVDTPEMLQRKMKFHSDRIVRGQGS